MQAKLSESPVVAPLRAKFAELETAVIEASRRVDQAQQRLRDAVDARAIFLSDLEKICDATGIAVETVASQMDDKLGANVHVRPNPTEKASMATEHPFLNPIALPSAPLSLRWYAGQVLNELDEEVPVSVLAGMIEKAGFQHAWKPDSPKQLEASLSALPNQVPWIARGTGRGSLKIDRRHLSQSRTK